MYEILTEDLYKDLLDDQLIEYFDFSNYPINRRIQSKNHDLKTIKIDKLIFTPFDDKRYLLNDGINSLPFGHYLVEKM